MKRKAIFWVLVVLLADFYGAVTSRADGTFIAAANRKDIVFDTLRGLLYISNSDVVLRYSLSARQFLSSYTLGGDLNGLDISPDGKFLAVADKTEGATTNRVFLVNLNTGVSRKVEFPLASGEGSTWTVAWGSDGRLLVTSQYKGSGWVPLRRYDPATGQTTVLTPNISTELRQNSMLCASGDHSVIGIAESNSSDGPWGRYRVADGDLVKREGYKDGTSWDNYEIGVARDGSQFALPTYGGTFIYNAAYEKIKTLGTYAGEQPIGMAYSPIADMVYSPWAKTRTIRVFNTQTWEQIGSFDAENTFDSPGNDAFVEGRTKVSPNGKFLGVTVDGGVRIWTIPAFSVTIATPTANSVVFNELTRVAGMALNRNNAISRVQIRLGRRSASGALHYWDGSIWGETPVLLDTTGTFSGQGVSWQCAAPLPRLSQWKATAYFLRAKATDSTGAITTQDIEFTGAFDQSAPTVTINTPSNGATVSYLSNLIATATDNSGGSGVASVVFRLTRPKGPDVEWWNGTAWVSTRADLVASLDYDNRWRVGSALPSGTHFVAGTYTLKAIATDNSGNNSSTTSTFSKASSKANSSHLN